MRGLEETVLLGQELGDGRLADPARDGGAVSVWYHSSTAGPREKGLTGLIDAGSILVIAQSFPPGKGEPQFRSPLWESEAVVVRGQPGKLIEIRRADGSNVDWRYIAWEQAVEGGTVVSWVVMNSPELFDKAQTLELANKLVDA